MATITTVIDAGGGANYLSAASWTANEFTNLVTDGDEHVAEFKGSTVDSAGKCEIFSWTTGAANRLTLKMQAGSEHSGKYDESTYHNEITDTFDGNFELGAGAEYCTIEGLQAKNDGSQIDRAQCIMIETGDNVLSDIIIDTNICGTDWVGTPSATEALIHSIAEVNLVVVNNLVFGNYALGISVDFTSTSIMRTVYNNTVAGGLVGMSISGQTATTRAFNNLMDGNGTDWTEADNPVTGNNCTSDATSPDGASFQNRIFTFVDAGSDDYHLAAGDVGASGLGTNLSADPDYAFNDDIDGDIRSAWDCGSDEKAVPAGNFMPASDSQMIVRF